MAAAAKVSIAHLKTSEMERARHRDRVAKLRARLDAEGIPHMANPSHIIPVMIGDPVKCRMISDMLMEDWGIASRLASLQGYAGCHKGYVTDLARHWLDNLSEQQLREVGIYACGPHPMLQAVVSLARDYELPVQVSLEEFMACAVGGCAGCTVKIITPDGEAMKRVCVDGPVFSAATACALRLCFR